jgi:hypothetical protein
MICGALGTINSAGSSSAREWTAPGASRALQRDHAAVGVPHHVRARYAELLHEGVAVRRLLRDAQRALRPGAAGEPAPVIHDQPIPVCQHRLRQERRERVGDMRTVHQHDGLSDASDLVFQLPAIDPCAFHAYAPMISMPSPMLTRRSRRRANADTACRDITHRRAERNVSGDNAAGQVHHRYGLVLAGARAFSRNDAFLSTAAVSVG